MKFSAITFLGLAALAAAAGNDTSAAPIPTHTLTATEKCINNCGTDICCKAKCVNVPCPDRVMANNTNDCVAQCPQKDAKQYAQCQQGCIKSYYWSATASLPVQTDSDASTTDASTTDAAATTTSAATSGSSASSGATSSAFKTAVATKAEASSTDSTAVPTATGNAAFANAPIAATVFGAAGFVAALFAL
ncbi:hypothetical protein AAP_06253 [Ascosphaera apis ARSEF 7405]|uniref:Uncharacterized protein n=1 Tax=Ascosphaera apis ARSEF 7405 TaxID=392613 RepID=A0A162HZY0_9EURO|nr:hypothetical protein AAP_06253 [Ascosphaera apis ARSEF 7405]